MTNLVIKIKMEEEVVVVVGRVDLEALEVKADLVVLEVRVEDSPPLRT